MTLERAPNLKALRYLADHLEHLDEQYWDFDQVIVDVRGSCQTIGCALGHCSDLWPHLFKRVKDENHGHWVLRPISNTGQQVDTLTYATEFFGIDSYTVDELFVEGSGLIPKVTKTDVAKRIRDYCTAYESGE